MADKRIRECCQMHEWVKFFFFLLNPNDILINFLCIDVSLRRLWRWMAVNHDTFGLLGRANHARHLHVNYELIVEFGDLFPHVFPPMMICFILTHFLRFETMFL